MKVERVKALSSDPHRNKDQLTDETAELEDCLIRSFIDNDHELIDTKTSRSSRGGEAKTRGL